MMRLALTSTLVLLLSSLTATAHAEYADGDPANPNPNPDGKADAKGDGDTLMPLPEAKRSIVMPATTIRGDFHVPIVRVGFGNAGATAVGFPFLGAGVSLTDWFQLDLAFMPLIVSPSVEYYSPEIAATFEFTDLDAAFEAGVRLGFLIPPGNNKRWAADLMVPLRIHAGDMVRIDTGVEVTVQGNTGGGDPFVGLTGTRTLPLQIIRPGIPIEAKVSVVDYVWVGLGTGFGMFDFTSNSGIDPGDTIFIPLGFGAGGNIPLSEEMILDAKFTFDFPLFALPAAPDPIQGDIYQVGITAGFHYTML
jgi:hypothetical protein